MTGGDEPAVSRLGGSRRKHRRTMAGATPAAEQPRTRAAAGTGIGSRISRGRRSGAAIGGGRPGWLCGSAEDGKGGSDEDDQQCSGGTAAAQVGSSGSDAGSGSATPAATVVRRFRQRRGGGGGGAAAAATQVRWRVAKPIDPRRDNNSGQGVVTSTTRRVAREGDTRRRPW
ncbi:hypothetical protein Scep_006440 [Stephania cephalantha]|uniref:Uncharacterized protein n=1 Tax=Stephania cephalantha TaxID=152367 RepID=A0AAP0PK29_9MAGN